MSEKEPSTATAKVALKLLKDIERRGVRILSERAVEETARELDAFADAAVQAERARWLTELDGRISKAENGKGDLYLWAAVAGLLRGLRNFMQKVGEP